MGEDKEQNLKNMEQFFCSDLNIKKMLMNHAPDGKYAYDQDSRMEYADKLFELLKDLEYEFSKTFAIFGGETKDFVQNALEKYK